MTDRTPTDGQLDYDEGVFIGYRAWERSGAAPAYPFGHGLGYTEWEYETLDATPDRCACGCATPARGPAARSSRSIWRPRDAAPGPGAPGALAGRLRRRRGGSR